MPETHNQIIKNTSYADIVKKGKDNIDSPCNKDTDQVTDRTRNLVPNLPYVSPYYKKLRFDIPFRIPQCNHKECLDIYNHRKKGYYKLDGGVGVAIIVFSENTVKILLGKERYGQFTNQYNICAGKMDSCDNLCCLQTGSRELSEEFKINLSVNEFISKNNMNYVILDATPIFILDYTYETVDLDSLNHKIRICTLDPDCPGHLREMSVVKWHTFENKTTGLSRLARKTINKLKEIL